LLATKTETHLDIQRIETNSVDDLAYIGIWEGALRCTSDIIPIGAIMLAHTNLEKTHLLSVRAGEKRPEFLHKHNIP